MSGAGYLMKPIVFPSGGHDFRPDYLNVSAFIASYSHTYCTLPHIGAFTATAKKDVIEEVLSHFNEKLSIGLESFIGGVQREKQKPLCTGVPG